MTSFAKLKSAFNNGKSKITENEEASRLYSYLLNYMKLYKQMAIQQNNAHSGTASYPPNNKFAEMAAELETWIEKITHLRSGANTILQERLMKETMLD